MKKNKRFAFNRLFNLCVVVGGVFLCIAGIMLSVRENVWGIGIGAIGLFFVLFPLIAEPCCYIFDAQGVTLHYIFLPNERYLWKNISEIHVTAESPKSNLLDPWLSGVFAISGRVEGKYRFYMSGHIRKSRRTKRLLEQYWDGTITGYLLEDIKQWFAKRRAKREKQRQAHLTDAVTPAEREARARVREWIDPFSAQAKQYGLELRAEYLYITQKSQELHSRPLAAYTYTVALEIARPGETDEERIICVSADLLYVRLGRTGYRSVPNRYAEEQLRDALTDSIHPGLL